ncbi:type VI secretion system contractile sheath domain-containing protein [Roseibium aggregatum]|uniref:Type VI secretion system contractile sheath large subunit n=1 Tax=Roseibium aggregatum TaxID=187304 RepID=A0A939J4Y4_9HYPH|nr:type VI secretion system contractile sheath large subunit [Roseibium aggregatum]MBN9671655.1 type VI secretion system contractile sheath large subunit [Roseibium aggregatum]
MSISIQNKLSRIAPPRVHLSREVEEDGAILKKEIPYVIGVLADLTQSSEHRPPVGQRAFVEIDRGNFDAVMAEVAPSVRVPLASGREVKLSFSRLSEFSPIHLIAQVPELADGHRRAQNLGRLLSHLDGNDAFTGFLINLAKDLPQKQSLMTDIQAGSGPMLDRVLEKGFLAAAGDVPEENLSALTDALLSLEPATVDPYKDILARMDELYAGLSPDLNAILRHPAFQAQEAVWRGLWFLVANADTGPRLKIRVLDVSKKELQEDFAAAKEPSKSALYSLVKSKIYRFGNTDPFSVLIGCYEFKINEQDLELLEDIRTIAAEAVCPFLSALAVTFPETPLDDREKRLWKAFRANPGADFVHLCAPRLLLRLPYGAKTLQSEVVGFEEDVSADGPPATYLWGSPVWHIGERISRAVTNFGWPAAISGLENGGLLENVPRLNAVGSGRNEALEVPFSPENAQALDSAGIVTASTVKGSEKLAFSANASADPKAAQVTLPRILTASRIAQCAHLVVRECLAASETLESTQPHVETWISQYVLLDDTAPRETNAEYPLRTGHVRLSEVPGGPYPLCVEVTVLPHFMLPKFEEAVQFKTFIPEVGGAA